MVRDKKAPPMGIPPRKKEMRKEIKPIQTISPKEKNILKMQVTQQK
jgi:hypothetical protein